jgi:hypothetical protein
MPAATFGMLDLSIVTDGLKAQLDQCVARSPLWRGGPPTFAITVTGDAPDVVRLEDGCHICLYLFHVVEDKFQSNSMNTGPGGFPRAQVTPFQPLALDLYYLLTAFSKQGGYVQEQQAMSIAMRCFHEHPIVTTTVPLGPAHPEQFTLTMEIQSVDELSRLWQATTTAIRLSAAYRVSVIFISPEAPPPPAPRVQRLNVLSGSTDLPFATAGGQVAGSRSTVVYRAKESTVAIPVMKAYDLSPAIVTPGQSLVLFGGGLTGRSVFLQDISDAEVDVTAWIDAAVETPSDTRLALTLPAGIGIPPAATPGPGEYRLRVGQGIVRSNSTPIGVAARIDNVGNPPILNPVAGVFTVTGVGFTGSVLVFLDSAALTRSNAAPNAGEFLINPAGTQIDLRSPAALPAGLYGLRIRVDGSESSPSWWLNVP